MSTLWGYLDPAEHAHMLLDEPRVDAFARAIAAVVRPGDVVLDVGTGTGILAILAARAGARRVYAVDRSGVVEVAKLHVAANGCADVVEVIRGALEQLTLPEPPRVIVGEQLGNFAPAEHQHRLFALARKHAAPDAVLIPSRYRFTFGLVRASGLRADLSRLADVHGVRLDALAQRLARRPAFVRVDPDELLGPEVTGEWLATDGAPPVSAAARFVADRDGEAAAIAVGFEAELAPGVILRTAVAAPRTHWSQTLFPIDPLPVKTGDAIDLELTLRIVTNANTWAWRAGPRTGDAADALIGDGRDLLAALGGRARSVAPPAILEAWAAALGAPLTGPFDADALAARLHAALPDRYPNVEEARQDVLALLASATKLV
jgi:SAM-dependent methyltransferase